MDSYDTQLNSPKVDEQGKPTEKAISSAKQAASIAKSMYDRAKTNRLNLAAILSNKYNGESPFNKSLMRDTAQDWRNNFSTHFMASVVDRVKPQFLSPIENVEKLTKSALPADFQDAEKKSEYFQECITKLIRDWNAWKDFCSSISHQYCFFGYASPAWLDDDWRPRSFKQDEAFLPEGSAQHASKLPLMVIRHPMTLHDFLNLFRDEQAAIDAGYNIESCRKVANAATSTKKDDNPMERSDAEREGSNLYDQNQIKVITLFHVLVQEYGGGVALWTVSESDEEIRHVEKLHDNMTEATVLMTMQTGNEKFYGSKGLAKMLVNLHVAIERGRCLGADQMYLSGLLVLSGDTSQANRYQPTVRHPFVLIDKELEVSKQSIQFQAEAYDLMDRKLVQLAESIAGAFIPPNIDNSGSVNTKIEAAQKAEREIAVRQGVLGRFFYQFSELISTMQKKICSTDNINEAVRVFEAKKAQQTAGKKVVSKKVYDILQKIQLPEGAQLNVIAGQEVKIADPEAVDCIVKLLEKGLSVEEIVILSQTPSAQEAAGLDKDPDTIQWLIANAQNPFVDQKKATELSASLTMGEDRTKEILVKDQEDPNVEAIAVRQQVQEFATMMAGEEVPVASTDNHKIHKRVLMEKMSPIMELIDTAPTPEIIALAKRAVPHLSAHVMMDTQETEQVKEQQMQAIELWVKVITDKEQELAEIEAQTGIPADQQPVPINGQPLSVQNGSVVGEEQAAAQTALDVIDKAHQAEIREREAKLRENDQFLKSQELGHKMDMDLINTGLKTVDEVAKVNAQIQPRIPDEAL